MNQQSANLTGTLWQGQRAWEIVARPASKYSLWVRFTDATEPICGGCFDRLLLNPNEEQVDLGPGRLLIETNPEDWAGRLVFTAAVYDLDDLISHRKLATIQSEFLNLPLMLDYKNHIRPIFKEFAGDLTYDLSIYRQMFDRMDAEYQGEPPQVRMATEQAILATEGRKFMRYLDDRMRNLEALVADFTPEEHKKHGFYFRRQLWEVIRVSPIMTRTNTRPRGYSGDSEMMLMIYANDYQGDSTFGRLMHKHPVEQPAAQAVRNRRELITAELGRMIRDRDGHADQALNVLSVACGPAVELGDLLRSASDAASYFFTLLDQDQDALGEAASLIAGLQDSLGTTIKVKYLNESVRTMLLTRHLAGLWGQFDGIYSMGLFDYLTPPVAAAVMSRLIQLLAPGGEMIVGNFHVSNPSRVYMDYWMDWVLYYRTEEDLRRMIPDRPDLKAQVFFEPTHAQMFLKVKARS